MKKLLTLAAVTLCLLAVLTACGAKSADSGDTQEEPQAGESAQEQTIRGIVNRVDDYLVLLDDSGEYHIFDFGENVDPTALEEGDSVTVTYTGTLDSEDPAPVAAAVEAAE